MGLRRLEDCPLSAKPAANRAVAFKKIPQFESVLMVCRSRKNLW
jgi:hypothetical protein